MKKIILTLAFITLLVFIGTTVLASSATVTPVVEASVTQISEGGNLSVTLTVDQITFPAGINSVSFKTKYDTDIFEQLDSNSFDAQNDWSAKYDPLSNEVTLSMVDKLQDQPGAVVKIDLKAKTGNLGKTTTITLSDMVFGDGISTPFKAPDQSTATITIGEAPVIPPIEQDPDPIEEPTTPKPVDPIKDKPDEIPDTGLADNLAYIIAGLFVVALGFYISYKKLEKKNIRYVNVE